MRRSGSSQCSEGFTCYEDLQGLILSAWSREARWRLYIQRHLITVPQVMKTWLVVGASRGIGAELCRQLLARPDTRVYGTVRGPSAFDPTKSWGVDGDSSSRHGVFKCDIASEASIDDLVTDLTGRHAAPIDFVVVNAGVLKYPNRATELSYDDLSFHLHTNTIGPVILAQRLLKSKLSIGTVAFMSSDSGSAQSFRAMEDGFAAYAASKAALNMMLRHMAVELQREKADTTILAIHPGEVATDMADIDVGWEVGGQMTPQESVRALIPVIESKKPEDSGTFWTWKNEQYPW